jgi:3-(3-hydroxy-phenyl)propionate hydroxylase
MIARALEDQDCDVLIVGLGPIGAAIAALLGRYGVRTVAVEREKQILMAPRAIALDNEALRILQTVGLARNAFEKVTIPRVRMRCPRIGEFVSIDVSGEIDGHPKLVTFYQPELERALRDLVASRTSVDTLTSIELVDLAYEDARVRASVQCLESGRRASIRAKYVVGADGARSKVRALIGQETKGQSYEQQWLVVDAIGVPNSIDHVEFLCDTQRPTPHMPGPGNRTRWEFMLPEEQSREAMESDEAVRALIAPWTKGAEVTIERKALYRFSARTCEHFRVGRVFLAGDAAHVTPPFVGQGLVAGLRDAINLAWKLAWTVKGWTSASVLDSYDQERRPHAAKMIALARVMGALVVPPSRARATLVHGALKTLGFVPGARAYMNKLGMKPKMKYPNGLFVPGAGALERGAWFGQTLVRRACGTVGLSDDVLGAGFALIGLRADPNAALAADTASAWSRLGGTVIAFNANPARNSDAVVIEALDSWLATHAGARPWCAVVRPDRTILHDGPAAEANRVVGESLRLLGARIGSPTLSFSHPGPLAP